MHLHCVTSDGSYVSSLSRPASTLVLMNANMTLRALRKKYIGRDANKYVSVTFQGGIPQMRGAIYQAGQSKQH